MKLKYILVIMLFLLLIEPAFSQEPAEDVVNFEEELAKFPYASQLAIKSRGDLSSVLIRKPLVIVGTNLDPLEQQMLDQVTSTFGGYGADVVYDDTIQEYEGESIWEYDLIVIGGPNHNDVARRLVEGEYLGIRTRDTNKPSFVIEKIEGPEGNTVLVAGDIYGYEFDEKDLPTEPFIPESAAAAAAVVTAVGASAAVVAVSQTATTAAATQAAATQPTGFLSKIMDFIRGGGEEVVEEVISERDVQKAEREEARPKGLFGFTKGELGIGIFSAIVFGVAYAWAELQSDFLGSAWIYIIAGGLAIIGHEFAHNVIAYRYELDAEFQVWKSGVALVALTSYLFGNVFATPGRSILSAEEIEKKTEGLIYLAGPGINILIAIILIPFAGASGFLGQLATIGIPMNLLVALYNLLPINPMDGTSIKSWRLSVWALFFIPTFVFYFWRYLL